MKKNTCSITGDVYYGFGNNAFPFEGRCSDYANGRYVIPARMLGITPEMIKAFGKESVMSAIDYKFHSKIA